MRLFGKKPPAQAFEQRRAEAMRPPTEFVGVGCSRIRFVYDDPEGTPPEAVATPVAVYRFDGVQAWQWEDDDDLFQVPVHVRGQVDDLAYYEPTNVFALVTLHSRLMVSAERLTVSVQQRIGD